VQERETQPHVDKRENGVAEAGVQHMAVLYRQHVHQPIDPQEHRPRRADAPMTLGVRHTAPSQAHCRRTANTASSKTMHQTVRCITTSRAGMTESCLK